MYMYYTKHCVVLCNVYARFHGIKKKKEYRIIKKVNNSKYMPICSILEDIAPQNMHDLEFDLSRSLKVKFIGVTSE